MLSTHDSRNVTTAGSSETANIAVIGKTTIVVGASRGLGRGIASSFAQAGSDVIAVSRSAAEFSQPDNGRGSIKLELLDAGDPTAAGRMLDQYDPDNVILVAGATPHMRPLHQYTWETFSMHWESDVRIAFHWLREILLRPLRPGSRVVVFSSAPALNAGGSPLSGGYAGAKATQRFITAYAQDEARRAGLDTTFTTIFPRFAPLTGVGVPAVRAYAARAGKSVDEFLDGYVKSTALLDPEIAGSAMLELIRTDKTALASGYVLTGSGLEALP